MMVEIQWWSRTTNYGISYFPDESGKSYIPIKVARSVIENILIRWDPGQSADKGKLPY